MYLFLEFFKKSPNKYYSLATVNGNDKLRYNINDNRILESVANVLKNVLKHIVGDMNIDVRVAFCHNIELQTKLHRIKTICSTFFKLKFTLVRSYYRGSSSRTRWLLHKVKLTIQLIFLRYCKRYLRKFLTFLKLLRLSGTVFILEQPSMAASMNVKNI